MRRLLQVTFLTIPFATLSMSASAFGSEDMNGYGSSQRSESALVGMLYDLKQDQNRRTSAVDNIKYWGVIDEFLASGWDESVLNKYFRASRLLYTTQVFIPRINAAEGPKAFGVANLVKPDRYVIHYKGQISPPEDGTYRFVGFGDNVLAVALDQKTVLFNDWCPLAPMDKIAWPSTPQTSPSYENRGQMQNGQWFTLKAGQVADLDVLIGEADGGASAFFLMIEKQGEVYPKTDKGDPILPIFQVAPYDTPHIPSASVNMDGPEFTSGPAWHCVQ